uniref:Sushi domain-containing protein n=1 Tax=Meleagris gallopavo TaxID=9103 RepID=A0A803Y8X6_MELGA
MGCFHLPPGMGSNQSFPLELLLCSKRVLCLSCDVMCPQPPNIANGLHSSQSTNKFLPGAVVHYSCKDGFKLVGNVSISCSDVGRWSRPLPRCQGGWRQPCGHCCSVPARCGPALTTISMFPQPSAARVPQCTMGRCRHSRTPSRLGRRCGLTVMLGMLQRAAIGLGASLGGAGTHQCSAVSEVSALKDPAWLLYNPVCTSPQHRLSHIPHGFSNSPAEVTCPPPPNIANGLHSSRSSARFPHGTVVYYSCKDGFELVGNVSISCLDVGRWSRPLPRCQGGWRQPCGHCCSVPAGCGPALTTISMFLQPSAARVPQLPITAIRPLHAPLSSPCLLPAVRPCPMPPKISNGDHNRHGEGFFTTGMSVSYTCDPSFYLVGNAHVVCKASGTWSQPSPRCEGVSVLTVGRPPPSYYLQVLIINPT